MCAVYMYGVQADVKGVLTEFKEIKDITHLRVHYLLDEVKVEVCVCTLVRL